MNNPYTLPLLLCGLFCLLPALITVIVWLTLQGLARRRLHLRFVPSLVENMRRMDISVELDERRQPEEVEA